MLVTLINICGENANLVKIGQKYVSSNEDMGSFHIADNDTYSSAVERQTMLRRTPCFVTAVTHPICMQLTATYVAHVTHNKAEGNTSFVFCFM